MLAPNTKLSAIVLALLSAPLVYADEPQPICAASDHSLDSLINIQAMGWYVSDPLSVRGIEEEAMEERRAYAMKPDSRKDIPMVPFGFSNDRWVEFKAEISEGDEIRRITTPAACWSQRSGWDGFALIRGGKATKFFMTLIN